MRFGLSGGYKDITRAKLCGFDFFEVSVSQLAVMDEAAFAAARRDILAADIPVLAGNGTFASHISLVGPEADPTLIRNYLELALGRMATLGCRYMVLGSGKRRVCPEGFDRAEADRQLAEAASIMGETAAKYDMTAVLEPLNCDETNMINTLSEGAALVRAVNHPNFWLLCDYYHQMKGNEPLSAIADCGQLLRHLHIACPEGRGFISLGDGSDYGGFFAALKAIGYRGDISFEGRLTPDNAEAECAEILTALRTFAEKYGL